MTDEPKRPRGRPVEKRMPELVPGAPESSTRVIVAGPPKMEWDYLKREGE